MFKLSRLFETGLSDLHKLISVVMISGMFKKKFEVEHFNIALKSELEKLND